MEKNDSLIQHSIFMFSSDWNKENKKKIFISKLRRICRIIQKRDSNKFFFKKKRKTIRTNSANYILILPRSKLRRTRKSNQNLKFGMIQQTNPIQNRKPYKKSDPR